MGSQSGGEGPLCDGRHITVWRPGTTKPVQSPADRKAGNVTRRRADRQHAPRMQERRYGQFRAQERGGR